jgi:hypothetical protein
MKFYEVTAGDEPEYAATFDAAKDVMRTADPAFRPTVTITEVDVPTDKENLLLLLNGGTWKSTLGRQWKGTARGGVVEVTST